MKMRGSTIYNRGNRHDMQGSLLQRLQIDVHLLVLCILPFFFFLRLMRGLKPGLSA